EETVRGQSRPWTLVERSLAESLRVSLLEIVFRLTDLADEERQRANQRQELLIAELNHRVRNILGLIRGLISQSKVGAPSVEAFAEVVG
ncbi:hybrid sensor histidine kinase/response regulator, partial [Bacillus sp. HSTU-bmb18]